MLVLHILLKFLLDLSLVISIPIVLIVIILQDGEHVSFQGPAVARLRVRRETPLRVALEGETFGFIQLLKLFVNDREVLPL